MDKQQNFFEYLVHEYLFFSQSFADELELEPQRAIQYLQEKLMPDASLIIEKASNDKTKVFRVTRESTIFRLAAVEGIISTTEGTTEIHYIIKVLSGIWILLLLCIFLWSIVSLITSFDIGAGVTAAITGILAFVIGFSSIRQRNQLIKLMSLALLEE